MSLRCARRSKSGSDGHAYVLTVPGRGYRLVGIDNGAEVPAVFERRDAPARGTSVAVLRFANLSGDSSQRLLRRRHRRGHHHGSVAHHGAVGGRQHVEFVCSSQVPGTSPVSVESLAAAISCRGSVRKADDRIRITARLVESDTGVALWAERYDRRFDDIFEVQDAIAMSLIGALEPNLRKAEINRVRQRTAQQSRRL